MEAIISILSALIGGIIAYLVGRMQTNLQIRALRESTDQQIYHQQLQSQEEAKRIQDQLDAQQKQCSASLNLDRG